MHLVYRPSVQSGHEAIELHPARSELLLRFEKNGFIETAGLLRIVPGLLRQGTQQRSSCKFLI